MANPGETIQGLEICIKNIDKVECPEECPYYEKCMAYERRCVFQPLLRDTLAILKAQQERIKELEELLHEGGCDGINACDVKACPYYNASHVRLEETKDEKIRELQAEIRKLKAAQQPRTLSFEEVRDDAVIVYLEYFSQSGTWIEGPFIVDHGESDKYLICFIESYDGNRFCRCSEYGKIWRCWTAEPTNEQREATSWT